MNGETDISKLIESMEPMLNKGEYVFTTLTLPIEIERKDIVCEFKEVEGVTIVIEKGKAKELNLYFDYVASWITLQVHSSLHAVGLTAFFSTALAKAGISCNVISGYYHDHIFVDIKNTRQAMKILQALPSQNNSTK